MLASFVISLRVERELALPGLAGEALHGLFFETLRAYDPAFAEYLHALPGEKPFSLSGVLGEFPKREGRIHIPANARVEFRLGLMTDEVIEQTLAAFGALATSKAEVRLGLAAARVEGIAFQPDTHPLVRSATYPTLAQNAGSHARVTLQFLSPTSFRAGAVQEILPRPDLVFGSLFRAWQTFSPVTFDAGLGEALPMVRVSDYDLRTELIHFGRYKVIGFKGRVSYTAPREANRALQLALNTLADFAFFAGVGYKTTMGLGQVKRWTP